MSESYKLLESFFIQKEKLKNERKEKNELELKNRELEEENEKLKSEYEAMREECEKLKKEKEEEVEEMRKENIILEKKNMSLIEEREKTKLVEEKSQEDDEKLNKENAFLKNQNRVLRKDLENLVGGRKKLDLMLGSQNCFYDKAGVGYDGSNDDLHDKKKKVAKPFVK